MATYEAVLPDGRVIEFPADSDDDAKVKAVKVIEYVVKNEKAVKPPVTQGTMPEPPGLAKPTKLPPGLPPQKSTPQEPMSQLEALGTGYTNQFLMNWGDELLAQKSPIAAELMRRDFEEAKSQHPWTTGAGQLAGGLASAYTVGRVLPFLGASGSLAGNLGKTALLGATEGAVSGAGEAKPGERLENAWEQGLVGGILGGISYPVTSALNTGFGIAARMFPGIRKMQGEELAYRRIGHDARANGYTPEQLKLELGKLGEESVLADIPSDYLKFLSMETLAKRQLPKTDIDEQLSQRTLGIGPRTKQELGGAIQTPIRSIIDDAQASGLTDFDVPLSSFDTLKGLSSNLEFKAKANFDKALFENKVIGVDTNGRPITSKVPKFVTISNETTDFLEKNPIGQEAKDAALKTLRSKDPDAELVDANGNVSMEFLDDIKSALNNKISTLQREGSQDYKIAIGLKDKFQQDLMSIPGNEAYADAIRGIAMARSLDEASSTGKKLSMGLISDPTPYFDQIAKMNPMQVNATIVGFMDGVVKNAGKLKPGSGREQGFKIMDDNHRQVFNALLAKNGATPETIDGAFNDLIGIVQKEDTFQRTAKLTNLNPKEAAQFVKNELRISAMRTASMPTQANVTTVLIHILNSLRGFHNKDMARTAVKTLFDKDIDDETWSLIEKGFNKTGALAQFKRTMSQAMSGGIAGTFSEEGTEAAKQLGVNFYPLSGGF